MESIVFRATPDHLYFKEVDKIPKKGDVNSRQWYFYRNHKSWYFKVHHSGFITFYDRNPVNEGERVFELPDVLEKLREHVDFKLHMAKNEHSDKWKADYFYPDSEHFSYAHSKFWWPDIYWFPDQFGYFGRAEKRRNAVSKIREFYLSEIQKLHKQLSTPGDVLLPFKNMNPEQFIESNAFRRVQGPTTPENKSWYFTKGSGKIELGKEIVSTDPVFELQRIDIRLTRIVNAKFKDEVTLVHGIYIHIGLSDDYTRKVAWYDPSTGQSGHSEKELKWPLVYFYFERGETSLRILETIQDFHQSAIEMAQKIEKSI
jgi:hypothetical protein